MFYTELGKGDISHLETPDNSPSKPIEYWETGLSFLGWEEEKQNLCLQRLGEKYHVETQ